MAFEAQTGSSVAILSTPFEMVKDILKLNRLISNTINTVWQWLKIFWSLTLFTIVNYFIAFTTLLF